MTGIERDRVALLLLALAITLAVPATSYFPILLLLAAGSIASGLRRLRGGGSVPPPVGD